MPSTSPRTPHPAAHRFSPAAHGVAVAGSVKAPLPLESDGVTAVRSRETTYRRALVLADVVSTLVALFTAIVLLGDGDQLRPLTLMVVALVVVTAKVSGLYDRDELVLHKSTVDELPRLFQLATLATFVIWLLSDELLLGMLGKGQALVLWVVLGFSMAACRGLARKLAGRLSPVERVLVVGDAEVLDRLRSRLAAHEHVELVGSVPFEHLIDDHLEELSTRALRLGAHRLIVAAGDGDGAVASPETVAVIRAAKATGLRVSLLPGVLDVVGTSVEFDSLAGVTLLGVRRFGLSRSSWLTKRALDVTLGGLGLLLVSPLLAVVAVAIKLDSPGPVLYRQCRVGRGSKQFKILKFRSMCDGADEQQASLAALNEAPDGLFKIADDPRITRVGRVLRRTSFDELPQLLNVLRGEMSLVGPRPLVAAEDRQITGSDRRRLQLTPGMTGQWQIAGSARVPLSEMVKLDYLYVAGWSVWSDVKILIRTVRYVGGRRGQ